MEEPKAPREPWLPPIVQPVDMPGVKVRRVSDHFKSHDFSDMPWANDAQEQTEEWADFLEDIENRGLTPWDPEAKDIWETYK